jgi:hypothetical protein
VLLQAHRACRSIVRPIVNVLAQRKGEAAFSLLPQWLSGYAFLFQSAPDVPRAKQLASALRLGPISLSYPANDAFLRSVAERVALNARDAGITIQPTPAIRAICVWWNCHSIHRRRNGTCTYRGGAGRGHIDSSKPEALYEAERSLLNRAIPLAFLSAKLTASLRESISKSSTPTRSSCTLEDAWVKP